MMNKSIQPSTIQTPYLFIALLILWCGAITGQETDNMAKHSALNVEELRFEKASLAMKLNNHQSKVLTEFNSALADNDIGLLPRLVDDNAKSLWIEARDRLQASNDLDDRWLYWQRLNMRRMLKKSSQFQKLSAELQVNQLWRLEMVSRGQQDILFKPDIDLKILLTGFDPFFLDREITQSNPSGAAAMALDGKVINYQGLAAQIEALVVPVRYGDFDQGMIETLLKPYYDKVDMIATISMGRTDFDLERFPGLRRSTGAPDNLNVYTGASAENPIIPRLFGQDWSGPEFVEFSLPAVAMIKAEGAFKINDNRDVTTLSGQKQPTSIAELDGETAVRGGGGGYLSNEISYRSIRLRDELNPILPVGHIHTPRISAFNPEVTSKIVAQIEGMLKLTLPVIQDKASQ